MKKTRKSPVRRKPVDSFNDTWWGVKLKDQPGKPGRFLRDEDYSWSTRDARPTGRPAIHGSRAEARKWHREWIAAVDCCGSDEPSPRKGMAEVVQVRLVAVGIK